MPELDLTWIKANLAGCIEADCMITMSPMLVSDLVDEIERLRREKGQTYCAYCGATFEIDAPDGAQAVSEHIRTCEKHPLQDAMREVRRLEAEINTVHLWLNGLGQVAKGETLLDRVRNAVMYYAAQIGRWA